MAGEYDDRFDELTGLVRKTIGGLDELRMEVRDIRMEVRDMRSEVLDMRSGLQENNSKLQSLTNKVTTLSSQFNDVGVMAIKDHQRVDLLEERVDVLESGAH